MRGREKKNKKKKGSGADGFNFVADELRKKTKEKKGRERGRKGGKRNCELGAGNLFPGRQRRDSGKIVKGVRERRVLGEKKGSGPASRHAVRANGATGSFRFTILTSAPEEERRGEGRERWGKKRKKEAFRTGYCRWNYSSRFGIPFPQMGRGKEGGKKDCLYNGEKRKGGRKRHGQENHTRHAAEGPRHNQRYGCWT